MCSSSVLRLCLLGNQHVEFHICTSLVFKSFYHIRIGCSILPIFEIYVKKSYLFCKPPLCVLCVLSLSHSPAHCQPASSFFIFFFLAGCFSISLCDVPYFTYLVSSRWLSELIFSSILENAAIYVYFINVSW